MPSPGFWLVGNRDFLSDDHVNDDNDHHHDHDVNNDCKDDHNKYNHNKDNYK